MEQFTPTNAFKLIEASSAAEAVIAASRTEANARLRFRVAQALVQGRVEFHYQPVVSAANTGAPAFFEMLARLRLPDGQLLAGGAFMPAIEAGALGRAIDRLALAAALKALAANPGLRLSVNMSPLSMGDEGWLALIGAAHRGGSGICGRLVIEITENAAMVDAGQTLDFMDHVRGTGCAFALDDFGAGVTGFRYFRDFRFDIVKIDGAFVRGVHAARDQQVLVECLGGLARHFEMLTVAEQVESEADAAWLREAGIDCLQGYLYGRPAAQPVLPQADADARRLAG